MTAGGAKPAVPDELAPPDAMSEGLGVCGWGFERIALPSDGGTEEPEEGFPPV